MVPSFYSSVSNFTQVCRIMVVDDVCCLYLCRFVDFRGVSATPTPQISWHKTTSARFRLLCHLLCTKSNKHMLTSAYAFVSAEKAYLCRSPCEHYGSRSRQGRIARLYTYIHIYIHAYMHTCIHTGHGKARPGRRQATRWKARRKDRPHTSQVTYLSNVCPSCRSA